MRTLVDDSEHRVLFGATWAAVTHALKVAWPAFLAAWAARSLLEEVRPWLRTNHIHLMDLPFGPPDLLQNLLIAAVLSVASGLLIRWLLDPGRAALRPDGRLLAYVGLMMLATLIASFLSMGILGDVHATPSFNLAFRGMAVSGVTLALGLLLAFVALWPVGVLVGDELSFVRAAQTMRQAFIIYLAISFVVISPGLVFTMAWTFTHLLAPHRVTERIWTSVISSCATVLMQFVLAQIYARRVRGSDLISATVQSQSRVAG